MVEKKVVPKVVKWVLQMVDWKVGDWVVQKVAQWVVL
jgi:hypothetical protein